ATWFLLWCVAFGLGAAHSIQPGHGKTIVAAASVGSGMGWMGGVLLALTTTFAHFASVFAIAAILWITPTTHYAGIQSALVWVAGLLVGMMGFWRIGRHLAGHVDHTEEDTRRTVVSRPRELIALGLAGGIIPCWDAVLLIVVAELAGMLGQGV